MTRWLIGCCFWLFVWHSGVVHAQNSAPCRKKLQQKDFQGAASCFKLLSQQHPKKLSFLRNQGIIHRMWSQQVKAKNPTQACQLMGRAIEIFTRYSKLAKGVDQLEMVSRITRLKSQRKLVNLSITTTPDGAELLLVGHQFKKKVTAPQLMTGLCPGTYHLRIELKDHYPRQTTLTLKPGQTIARNFTLRSRIKRRPPPRADDACPMNVSNLLGPRGCTYWRQCRDKKGKACAWLSHQYRERGDFLRTLNYSSMSCELKYYPACLRAGMMHLSEGRPKLARKYLTKGCDNGLAETCHRLGDFYAGRYANRGARPRQCRLAIRTYHRACKLGRRASCTATCNTVNVALPIIIHTALHVGGLVAGGALTGTITSPNGEPNFGTSLILGGLSLAVECLYIPLWLAAFRKHHIGLPVAATATIGLPIIAAISLYAGALSLQTTNIAFGQTLQEMAIGLLVLAVPVHAMWAIYTWLTYKSHEDTIRDVGDAKPKISWIIAPTFTPQGAGFAISGVF